MFVGTIVHDSIQAVINKARRQGWDSVVRNDVGKDAVDRLRQGIQASLKKRCLKEPKAINLHEHWYGPEPTQDDMLANRDKVVTCIDGFFNSWVCDHLPLLQPKNWIEVEEFSTLKLDTGEVATVKIDCSFYDEKGFANIIDWKTGRPSPNVAEQMTTYGMYAVKVLKIPFSKLMILPVYLADNEHIMQPVPCKMDFDIMKQHAQTIREEYAIVLEASQKSGNMRKFPVCEDPRSCRDCPFKEICKERPQ